MVSRDAFTSLILHLPPPPHCFDEIGDETSPAEVAAASEIQIPPGTVRLRSSDGHLVPVDRSTLAAHSSVFRGTMEVVSANEEAVEYCPVSETLEELEILVKGLKGNANRSEAEWLTLYKIMDKYDMESLRVLLRLMAWSVELDSGE